jgi:hypothetical protein
MGLLPSPAMGVWCRRALLGLTRGFEVDGAKVLCHFEQAMETLRRGNMNSGAERDGCSPSERPQGGNVFNVSVNASSGAGETAPCTHSPSGFISSCCRAMTVNVIPVLS